MLAIELLDELVGSARAAAWPLIRDDLGLSYAEVGLVLAVPGFVGSALDPLVGVLGDTARRRALLLAGGLVFALSAGLTAASVGFWTLLVALVIGNPATGAFVSLAQATLMDLAPERRERNMAWWTLAGSVGYLGGPVLLAAALWLGFGWRGVMLALAAATLPLVVRARRLPVRSAAGDLPFRAAIRSALAALRRREVLRWLALLEAADLLLDVLHGFLALYLVDAAGFGAVGAALALAVWTGAGLVGDALLVPLLARVPGPRHLRWTAAAALVVYPAFLVIPGMAGKLPLLAVLGLLNAGWYAIPKAGLYAALPGRSGAAVAVGGVAGVVGAGVPLALGFLAEVVGIAATMWLLALAPVALLALVPRR
ncbi:MAG: MFS transporter [Thermoleophilia bacterium]|nr:MFS transporter [Thermoleophilia bacterium]